MPKGIPLTEQEQQRRRKEIFDASVHLFLEKGFSETSMREIADAAGIGKSTLYDYFRTKDEILLSVIEQDLQMLIDRATGIADQKIREVEKIRQLMLAYVEYLAGNEEFYLKLSIDMQRLAQKSLARIQAKRHAYQDLIRRVIEDGMRSGCFRKVDSLLAARMILTALTPAVFTTRPSGTQQEMVEEAFDMIMRGLQA